MPAKLTKSALIESIAKLQDTEISKRQVKSVIEAMVTVGHRETVRAIARRGKAARIAAAAGRRAAGATRKGHVN